LADNHFNVLAVLSDATGRPNLKVGAGTDHGVDHGKEAVGTLAVGDLLERRTPQLLEVRAQGLHASYQFLLRRRVEHQVGAEVHGSRHDAGVQGE